MRKLRLFTAFHANLDFSALPEHDVPIVIERCYWPLLQLAEQARFPIGLEMPARTLERLARDDPDWLKTLRALAERGLVEVIGSGWAQIVAPLAPLDVNRQNLRLGRERYQALLGHAPNTWFVNEQTFAAGLPDLYREVGAQALVMEWNNPASRRAELRPLRYQPVRLHAATQPLPLLWNDCVVFQRLQRAVQREIPLADYLAVLDRVHATAGASLLCAYGGDLEIFDYRPGRPAPAGAEQGAEMGRLARLLRTLAADARFEPRLPGQVAADLEPGPLVELASAEDPLPCKKQPRYNPTRWAASGRDGIGINTRCFALRRTLRIAAALERDELDDPTLLPELWRSDLRTRATEEKLVSFQERIGGASARAHELLARHAPPLASGWDAMLANVHREAWEGDPVEIPLRLPPGRLRAARVRADAAAALPPGAAQVEVHERHRDGSLRRVTVVLAPRLDPGECVQIGLEAACPQHAAPPVVVSADRVRTEQVEACFLPHRGGALASLRFPGLGPEPVAGTLPHGSFDEIAYTPDFYSGHVVGHAEEGAQITDLVPASVTTGPSDEPLRVRVTFRARTPLGEWRTRYRIYRDRPRLDLVHELAFQEARLRTLRLGIVTLCPDAFERSRLGWASVNGGLGVERWPLAPGARLEQGRAVSPAVTATSCLGATEGWISVGDAARGLGVIGDRAAAAALPLLDFADVDERFFFRVSHTLAESDETRAGFFRGTLRAPFALIGHAGRVEAVRRTALAIERGLLFRTEQDVGIARGV